MFPDSPDWHGPSRVEYFRHVLESDGHTVGLFPLDRDRSPHAIELAGHDIVCNHAMQAPIDAVRELAIRLPKVKFININHSALSHLERVSPKYVNRFTSAIHSARQLPNIWYASQDIVAHEVGRATGVDRCVWIPTPGKTFEPRPYRPVAERPTVVIAGRCDPIKNNLVQLIACALIRDRIHLAMCLEPDEAMLNTLHALQYEPEVLGLLNHGAWIDYLKTTADITLCCSLAESYGFVASEAMQIGVPVVASNAIKFAHDELTIKHNTPQMIADRIEHAITHHERLAGECSSLASVEADYQIVEYLRQLRRIAV